MRSSIWQTQVKAVESCEVSRRAPDARRDGGKREFFRKAIFVRKSLSCFTSEIRAWSERSGKVRVVRCVWRTVPKVQPPIRPVRSRAMGRGEDGANGRAKPSLSGMVSWFASVRTGAARTRRREGCKRARSKRGCARACRDTPEPLNASRKAGVSAWYAVLVEPAKTKRIFAG
jgi:hypothetical protein